MEHRYTPSFKQKLLRRLIVAGLLSGMSLPVNHVAFADDTQVETAARKNYAISAGPLGKALSTYAAETGVLLSFDPALTEGKSSAGLTGEYSVEGGFRQLLQDTGLEVIDDQSGGYFLVPAQIALPDMGENTVTTDTVNVRASRFKQVGPIPGLALTKEEIPGNVQSLSSEQIKQAHSVSLADLMNTQLQSVNVNDYQGNPFQMDVTYRGFTASPQIGTPQGLSIFFDGIRVNEPFGDVVNWDMIPTNALAGMDVFPGSNPVFGLNTLGGAIALRTKNGFDDPGTEFEILRGAWGRKQYLLSAGGNNGTIGGFVSMNMFDEDGWRDNSPSEVKQIFSKLSYRTDNLDLHGSVLYAENNLIGNGLVPKEMYDNDPEGVFTSPDETKNKLLQYQIAGAFQVNDTFSVTGQVYRRESDRKAVTGDINQGFRDYKGPATRRAAEGENLVCAYPSTNPYGIPDYYVVREAFGDGSGLGISSVQFGLAFGGYSTFAEATVTDSDFDGFVDIDTSTLNQPLPPEAVALIDAARDINANMFHGERGYQPNNSAGYISPALMAWGDPAMSYDVSVTGDWWTMAVSNISYFTVDSNGDGDLSDETVRYYLIPAEPLNGSCGSDDIDAEGRLLVKDDDGHIIKRNGTWDTSGSRDGKGYIAGTPTSIISTTEIDQITEGGALQFNWDTGRHKFLLGGSIDHAKSSYSNSQMLGLLTASREAYLAPDQIGAEFSAATLPLENNDFSGSNRTESIYFSETFNPRDNLHLSMSARYNYTRVMTNMAVRTGTEARDVMDYQSAYMQYLLCEGDGLESCDQYLLNNPRLDPRLSGGEVEFDNKAFFGDYEKEVATYHKLNPAFGISWSPNDRLNLYGNWNQGTRTPTAIELGCAFDDTPVFVDWLGHSLPGGQPRSLVNGRSCTLPTALSGDPYLPQVVARTLEFGARGALSDNLEWNASIYQTNLFDDIYFVSYRADKSFFDTIGRTRRQGIELGLSGEYDKWNFGVNYSLTDATFQSTTKIANEDNSSVNHTSRLPDYNMMTIRPNDRMPGIPLHNLNLNVGYKITPQWRFNLNMVAHSSSYARGNENNEHRAGNFPIEVADLQGGTITVPRRYINDGKTPGYAVFNLSSTYDFGDGLSATFLVNNIFDKEYYSASRLGVNPFSPSINGAVDPVSGWNYNSGDWNSTNFVAPGAPRAFWASVRWAF